MKEVVITSLIEVLMIFNGFTESKWLKHILFLEQRRNSNSIGCTQVWLIKNAAKMRPHRNYTNYKSYSCYPEKLRRKKYYDIETNVEFVF